jgi:ubiquinol-cytochrome c reductase cytochrome b subunit
MSIDTSKVATTNATAPATASKPNPVGAVAGYMDDRTGLATAMKKQIRKVFPDHWSFMLGEIALWSFIILLLTGVFLTFWFTPSMGEVTYEGSYDQLRGIQMSEAYASSLNISFDIRGGLLVRQMHHWAAMLFVAAMMIHLLRVFFTGAYRKPREVTYWLGVTILGVALLEGYLGYSLVDDLLSGMGLAIGNAVLLSLPLIGANLALLLWDGPFPGGPDFFPRMYIAHVFLIPALIAVLLSAHLFLVASRHHTQFAREPRQTERKLVGVPTFPGQTPRSIGLLLAVAGTLFLLGGLVQINPIWLWGPYHVSLSTNGAQPDWYLGWLIGALRLMPGFDVTIGDYTLVPNPFWGGILLPLLVFGFLFVWPVVERKLMRDDAYHNLLDRPRDAPLRTALGTMVFVAASVTFLAGSADRVTVLLGLSYTKQVWFYRILFLAGPPLAGLIAHRVCVELRRGERVEEDIARARAEAEASSAD